MTGSILSIVLVIISVFLFSGIAETGTNVVISLIII